MPKDRKRTPRNGQMWSLELVEDDAPVASRVRVRLGARLVATLPGRVHRIARLQDGKLVLSFEEHPPVLLDLFTGETLAVGSAPSAKR